MIKTSLLPGGDGPGAQGKERTALDSYPGLILMHALFKTKSILVEMQFLRLSLHSQTSSRQILAFRPTMNEHPKFLFNLVIILKANKIIILKSFLQRV